MTQNKKLLDSAHKTLDIEISTLHHLKNTINDDFVSACEMMEACNGKVVVCGVGKSGHIANKIAATLASTGTPAFSLHPTEASHGDLGAIEENDLLLAISNSGASAELTNLIPAIKHKRISIIAITGDCHSLLANAADVHLAINIVKEACPHNLAPTASTTATLVLGDMLAIALLEKQGFSKIDFATSHPGGKLGKRLILRASDIMHQDLPLVDRTTKLQDALLVMTSHKLGMLGITDDDNRLAGIYTDGDLRRTLEREGSDWVNIAIEQVISIQPITITTDTLAVDALELFEQKKINGIFVVDNNNRPVGVFNMHDLLQSGIV